MKRIFEFARAFCAVLAMVWMLMATIAAGSLMAIALWIVWKFVSGV